MGLHAVLPFVFPDCRDALKVVGMFDVELDLVPKFDRIDVRSLVSELSVSEQQVVEIAKALAGRPKILILDERHRSFRRARATSCSAKFASLPPKASSSSISRTGSRRYSRSPMRSSS